jgi:protein TonB
MVDNIKINTQKGLFFSFLLHSAVVFFYLFFIYTKTSSPKLLEQKMLTMEIIDIAPIAQIPTKPIQKQPQPVVLQKVVEPKKIVESKPIIEEPQIQHRVVQEEPKPILAPPVKYIEVQKEEIKPVKLSLPSPQLIATQEVVKIEPKQEKVIVQDVPPKIATKNEDKLSKTDFEIIRDKISSSLVYPNIARRMGWQGVVQIELTINENGRLINAKVHQSSGKPILDKSALDASLQLQSEQLPKPKTTTTLILPVAFNLKGVA